MRHIKTLVDRKDGKATSFCAIAEVRIGVNELRVVITSVFSMSVL